ncbi:MAG: pyruvate, phosphate dikinase/phosphoenolpyruvate synthase regulator [Nitrospirae bacterium]|nr:MAG: pyruvate, phosphate dikinase/phosphoenolpyruvate synthase regulator [Nitrospirota bacterium]
MESEPRPPETPEPAAPPEEAAAPPPEREPELHLFIVSDATGRTAEQVIDAALYQFQTTHVVLHRFPRVLSRPLVDRIVDQASELRAVMVCTVVEQGLSEYLHARAREAGVAMVDIMGPIVEAIGKVIHRGPLGAPRAPDQRVSTVRRRADAIAFTVRHDDGRRVEEVGRADVVLLGVSRAGKTPTSVYLATHGWRVANIPIVPGVPLPPVLEEVDPRRVFVLTRAPAVLARLRQGRTAVAGGRYTDPAAIREEVRYAREEVARWGKGWREIDVTTLSIEETATTIEQLLAPLGRRPR